MFVIAEVLDQVVARFLCGSVGAKKLCAHVVVDPKHTHTVCSETPHGFRANQSRRTCDDDRAHHGCRNIAMLCYDSAIIHVTSPVDGFTRAAGNCRSPASTRSIS